MLKTDQETQTTPPNSRQFEVPVSTVLALGAIYSSKSLTYNEDLYTAVKDIVSIVNPSLAANTRLLNKKLVFQALREAISIAEKWSEE